MRHSPTTARQLNVTLRRRWQRCGVAVIALLLLACGDAESPTSPGGSSIARPVVPQSSVAPEGISITDDDGRVYTLDVDHARIKVSTGEVLELPESMLGAAMDVFIANNEDRATSVEAALAQAGYNQEYRGFETPELRFPSSPAPLQVMGATPSSSAAPYPEPDLAGERPQRGRPGARRHLWGVDPSSIDPHALQESRRIARSPSGKWTVRNASNPQRESRRESVKAPGLQSLPPAMSTVSRVRVPSVASYSFSSDPESCVDIARSIYTQTAAWRVARDNWKEQLRALLPRVTWDPLTSVWAVKRPEMEQSLNYDLAADNYLDKQIALNYMAIQYSLNGCHSNLWPDNSQYWGGTGSLSSSPNLVCHPEQWEISFDGGETWTPITVSVCEFNQT